MQSLAEAFNRMVMRLPRAEVRRLFAEIARQSRRHGMVMYDDQGRERLIEIRLRPWFVQPAQHQFYHRLCLTLRGALARLYPLYAAQASVRRILPVSEAEAAWLAATMRNGRLQRPQTVFDRLDANAVFDGPDWSGSIRFVEVNAVGVGGIHYMPTASRIIAGILRPLLRRHLPGVRVRLPDDIRLLLLERLHRHARAIGRRLRCVGFLEDIGIEEGTDEYFEVAKFFRRHGVRAFVVYPRRLRRRGEEIYHGDDRVDLFYRDSEIEELLEMEARGEPMGVIREAFRCNRVVSSVAGDFDHKSVWELLTNPEFRRCFTAAQRRFCARYLAWTRLLWERRTTDPNGRSVDLAPYVRRHRERLILKPNREYGGVGVVIGSEVTQVRWERALERFLRQPSGAVVQECVPIRTESFPILTPRGVRIEPFYVVSGFAATPNGLAILGRCSKERVVNVSRRGGLIPTLIAESC